MPLEIVACVYDTFVNNFGIYNGIEIIWKRVISNDLINITPFKYFYNYAFAWKISLKFLVLFWRWEQ